MREHDERTVGWACFDDVEFYTIHAHATLKYLWWQVVVHFTSLLEVEGLCCVALIDAAFE